jgi:hypothetical protein
MTEDPPRSIKAFSPLTLSGGSPENEAMVSCVTSSENSG